MMSSSSSDIVWAKSGRGGFRYKTKCILSIIFSFELNTGSVQKTKISRLLRQPDAPAFSNFQISTFSNSHISTFPHQHIFKFPHQHISTSAHYLLTAQKPSPNTPPCIR